MRNRVTAMGSNKNKKIYNNKNDLNNNFENIQTFLKGNISNILAAALVSYLAVTIFNIFGSDMTADTLNFVENVNGILTFALFVPVWALFGAVSLIKGIGKKLVYTIMLIEIMLFACLVIINNNESVYLSAGVSAVVCFFIYYVFNSGNVFSNKLINSYKLSFIIVAVAFVLMSVWMSVHTINRYLSFSASNFDFGIFAQLFENMAKHGSTVISVERNELMSHFYNHFSPIYYVILPIYMIFRCPEALLGIQAVFVLGSCFPVFMIGRKYGFSPLIVMLLGLTVIFLPGFVAPMFYDFHENKFLPFFMLWFIYFFMDKKYIPAYVFMFLTLMIKEDAAIYVIFTFIYFMLVKKDIKYSLIGLGLTVLYFIPVMIFIRTYGLDFVGWRYGVYFLDGQDKIIQMVQNIILNPAFFIKNVFSEKCVIFIVYMLGSLLFVPLVTKDFKKFVLLIPFVAINIMTDYEYQHDIGFQYTYGSLSLMLVLFIDNISVMKDKWKTIVCLSALCVSFIMMLGVCSGDFKTYTENYENNKAVFDKAEEELNRIPEGVSITANTFILPHLCDHEELYMKDDNYRRTDYYVLDSWNSSEVSEFENDERYSEYVKCYDGGKVKIYKLPSAPELLSE